MPIITGEVIEGTVAKITEYGAFINLPDGKRGLVHISEIADAYVTNINDYIKEREKIKVKILSISEDGRRIDLSIKQLKDNSKNTKDNSKNTTERVSVIDNKKMEELHYAVKHHNTRRERINSSPDQSFEEKLTHFLKSSEERLADLKRNIEAKRGGGKYKIGK